MDRPKPKSSITVFRVALDGSSRHFCNLCKPCPRAVADRVRGL